MDSYEEALFEALWGDFDELGYVEEDYKVLATMFVMIFFKNKSYEEMYEFISCRSIEDYKSKTFGLN